MQIQMLHDQIDEIERQLGVLDPGECRVPLELERETLMDQLIDHIAVLLENVHFDMPLRA